MCQCTPNIRTPFCGRGNCQWPDKKKEGTRPTAEATVRLYADAFVKDFRPTAQPYEAPPFEPEV